MTDDVPDPCDECVTTRDGSLSLSRLLLGAGLSRPCRGEVVAAEPTDAGGALVSVSVPSVGVTFSERLSAGRLSRLARHLSLDAATASALSGCTVPVAPDADEPTPLAVDEPPHNLLDRAIYPVRRFARRRGLIYVRPSDGRTGETRAGLLLETAFEGLSALGAGFAGDTPALALIGLFAIVRFATYLDRVSSDAWDSYAPDAERFD